MDADTCLIQLCAINLRILAVIGRGEYPDQEDTERAAQLFLDLDTWLRGGGSPPSPWRDKGIPLF